MSRLWNWVDSRNLSNDGKKRLFIFLNCVKYCVYGLLTWLIVSKFVLDTWDWALCFIGYPGFFIGYIGSHFFLFRNK